MEAVLAKSLIYDVTDFGKWASIFSCVPRRIGVADAKDFCGEHRRFGDGLHQSLYTGFGWCLYADVLDMNEIISDVW